MAPTAIEPTADPAAYFADPRRHRLERRRFCCASPGPELFALIAWGRIEACDAEELIDALEAAERLAPRDRVQLVVLRDVEAVAAAALSRLMRFYQAEPAYMATVAREAVVRPEGVVAMIAEGFSRVVRLPFPSRVFVSEAQALAWLGPGLPSLDPWVASWRAAALERGRASELAVLDELIDRVGVGLSVTEAASVTGHSARTLQRRLQARGTNFAQHKRERIAARAKAALRDPSRDIKGVAFELGFSAPRRFSEWFARETGRSPAAWRATEQGDDDDRRR